MLLRHGACFKANYLNNIDINLEEKADDLQVLCHRSLETFMILRRMHILCHACLNQGIAVLSRVLQAAPSQCMCSKLMTG
jgi:hypothetical protein